MGAIERLSAAGFLVELVPPDMIGITPVERLSDAQRQWITTHRDTLLAELKAANDSTLTWQVFIDCCVDLGASADEVAAMFRQQDVDDVCTVPASQIHLHASTIVEAIKRKRPHDEPVTGKVLCSILPRYAAESTASTSSG